MYRVSNIRVYLVTLPGKQVYVRAQLSSVSTGPSERRHGTAAQALAGRIVATPLARERVQTTPYPNKTPRTPLTRPHTETDSTDDVSPCNGFNFHFITSYTLIDTISMSCTQIAKVRYFSLREYQILVNVSVFAR